MKNTALFSLLFLFSFSIQSQTTGSFQISVTFPQQDYNENRTLYFYVPENYDADNSYKLLVGFRGGPHSNAGQFRDQLKPLSDSLDAIILCPENEAHFWNEEGKTKLLFQYSVDTAMSLYNIDPDLIYLTGLSYGGRHAVIVATDTDDGPIPNLRGVIPFAAGTDSQLQPNYDNVSEFSPACICIGLSDNSNFINVSNTLHNDIQSNGGTSFLNEISGVGHTVSFPTYPNEMMECFNFIEEQYIIDGTREYFNEEKELLIYPNPATSEVNLDFINNDENVYEITLINSAGKLIKKINPEFRKINIGDIKTKGIYYLIIKSNNYTTTKKIMIGG